MNDKTAAARTTPGPACNLLQPGPANSHYNVTVASSSNVVTIYTTRMACGHSIGNRYELTIEDDENFTFFGDVSPATMAALTGIYRAFMRFARYGFDREP